MGFDITVALERAAGGRTGAWAFVREYAEQFVTPIGDGDGCAVDEAEERLGMRLPAAVREAYALFGRRGDLTSNQDELLRPDELRMWDGVLVHRVENQACAYWGVTPSGDDPPVFVRPDLDDKSAEKWEPFLDRFSLACVQMVLAESLLLEDGRTDCREVEDAGELPRIERAFTPLAVPDVDQSRWYANDDAVVRVVDGGFLMVRGRTSEALAAVLDQFRGDWLLS
ncbi:MAG: SMI1/KNR4 family protein [Saccharothrix sp.]|nr:SMI1/KNR4 family protein [Saccharothrix sp.]